MRLVRIIQLKVVDKLFPEVPVEPCGIAQFGFAPLFIFINRHETLGLKADDRALDNNRLGENARLDETSPFRHFVHRDLNQAEREMKRALPLQKVRDCGHTLADAVTADQQQKPAMAKASGNLINEFGFGQTVGGFGISDNCLLYTSPSPRDS